MKNTKKAQKEKQKSEPIVERRLLDIKTAAAYLSSSVWFLRSLIWSRQIPFLKLGNRYLFDKKDLDAFIERQKVPTRM